MSEATDKVIGMKHLPLFPLPLVLLPGEMLPLHIFEPRYRKMLADVTLERGMFGVSFLDSQTGLVTKPAAGSVGCVAEVRDTQMLPDGTSNITTVGIIRYTLVDYVETGDEYLIANVDFFEDDEEDAAALEALADEVYELFERVAKAAFQISGSRGRFPEIPREDAQQLSFLITAAFNLENDLKYRLLETRSTSDRLEKLKAILVQTVEQMEDSADIHKVARTNGHSKKKIDL